MPLPWRACARRGGRRACRPAPRGTAQGPEDRELLRRLQFRIEKLRGAAGRAANDRGRRRRRQDVGEDPPRGLAQALGRAAARRGGSIHRGPARAGH
eukprot:10018867-Alexandrium_andersonii.AAC.1